MARKRTKRSYTPRATKTTNPDDPYGIPLQDPNAPFNPMLVRENVLKSMMQAVTATNQLRRFEYETALANWKGLREREDPMGLPPRQKPEPPRKRVLVFGKVFGSEVMYPIDWADSTEPIEFTDVPNPSTSNSQKFEGWGPQHQLAPTLWAAKTGDPFPYGTVLPNKDGLMLTKISMLGGTAYWAYIPPPNATNQSR